MTTASVFDITTVYLLSGISSAVGAAILVWLRGDHRESGPALTLFATGLLVLGASFVVFALHEGHFGTLGPIVGYGGFGIAAVLTWLASSHLYGTPVRTKCVLIGLTIYLAILASLYKASPLQAMARIMVSNLFLVGVVALAALQAHRSRWLKRLRAVRLMRALMGVLSLVLLAHMLAFATGVIPVLPDGTSPAILPRLSFALAFGSIPFAMTVAVLSIANSQLSAQLRLMATTDDLTGLVARRSLRDSAQRLLAQSREPHCIALLMIDLDNFKTINDEHGHSVGDQVLCHVADTLRRRLRSDALISRYGGDEFCALVSVSGEAAAFVVAERLRAAMESSPYRFDGQEVVVTLSIGVTVHRSGATLDQLFDEADRRAYRAKASGRNRVVDDDRTPETG